MKCKLCGGPRPMFGSPKITYKALDFLGIQREYTIKVCAACAVTFAYLTDPERFEKEEQQDERPI